MARGMVRVASSLVSMMVLSACTPQVGKAEDLSKPPLARPTSGEQVATFAGGCFWCMEPPFEGLPGVRSVMSGYAGGSEKNPSYKDVSYGRTGHTEAVQVIYDPKVTTYEKLVDVFLRSMDPTDLGGQFADRGRQYRPAIFVHTAEQRKQAEKAKRALEATKRFDKPIVVPVQDFTTFYPAETYHQDYYKKNPTEYKRYRKASGRSGFLKRVWGKDIAADHHARYSRPSRRDLKQRLSPLSYQVTQQAGTEPPFKNAYWDNYRPGIYVDVVTGEPLFSSQHKFKSGTGWPSFTQPLVADNVVDHVDSSHGMRRVEVRSKHGDSHLGHVFEDGPAPTHMRYCINSAALRFVPRERLAQEGYGEFAHLFK